MEGSSFVSNDSRSEDHGQVCASEKLRCNICDLEPFTDPVVTSCGHLYCWACLNKRLENQSQKHCPACASPLMNSANFIKIYGTDSGPLDEQPGLQCRICLESPPPKNAVATSCGHVFCWLCLYQWLHRHRRDQGPCPACKNILKRGVNILPVCGHQEVHAGHDVSSRVGAIAEVATSGGFVLPPRPSPPEDVFALSSRKYATSNDELESDVEDELESEDEFNLLQTLDPNADMSAGAEPHAEMMESLWLAVEREMGETEFRRVDPALRSFLNQELLRLMRTGMITL